MLGTNRPALKNHVLDPAGFQGKFVEFQYLYLLVRRELDKLALIGFYYCFSLSGLYVLVNTTDQKSNIKRRLLNRLSTLV
jgi:hypothetical protein